MPGPADLDDLVAGCRSDAARDHLREAVDAYRAGAYRASIVSTWVAVVYDVIGKLQELALTGDKNAQKKLDALEVAHTSGEYRDANQLEDQVVTWARDEFEFLTPLEALDIERLHADRHRCAHPALLAQNEPYRPTAELARSHLRSAAVHLLHRQPVQGKAALDSLFGAVRSSLFSTDPAKAERYLRTSSPLSNAREPLVRDFVIGLATALVTARQTDDFRDRQLAALKGAVEIRRAYAEKVLLDKLPAIVDKTSDDDWGRLLQLAGAFPFLWSAIGEGAEMKTAAFVERGDPVSKQVELDLLEEELDGMRSSDPGRSRAEARRQKLLTERAENPDLFEAAPDLLFATVLDIDALQDSVQAHIADLDPLVLADQVARAPHAGFVPTAIQHVEEASSFREGEFLVEEILLPLASLMSPEQGAEAVQAIGSNRQVYDAGDVRGNLADYYETFPSSEAAADAWVEIGVKLAPSQSYRSRKQGDIQRLAERMREAWPDHAAKIDEAVAQANAEAQERAKQFRSS